MNIKRIFLVTLLCISLLVGGCSVYALDNLDPTSARSENETTVALISGIGYVDNAINDGKIDENASAGSEAGTHDSAPNDDDGFIELTTNIESMDFIFAQSLSTFEATAPDELKSIVYSDETLLEAVTYAYIDLDTVPPQLVDTILESRYLVASCLGWVSDEIPGGVWWYETDGNGNEIRVELPVFSSLFPGWTVPQRPTTATQE